MESMPVSEFRQHCLEVVERVRASGNPVELTQDGEPMAIVVSASVLPQLVRNNLLGGKAAGIAQPRRDEWDLVS